MLDENRSGPEIVSMAAAGEIYGFGPFRIPKGTVYYLADLERQRRQREIDAEHAKTPEGQAAVTHRRSMAMIERERKRLEREAAKTGKLDVVRMDRLASAQNKLNRGQPRLPASQALEGSNGTSAPPKPKQEQSDFQHQDHAEPRHQQD